MNNCGAIILAAGKGTRMKSNKAKVTFQLAEKPLLQRVVDVALKLKCNPVAIVVGYKKDETIASLNPDSNLYFVEQKEQKGTGHAVMTVKDTFKDFDGELLILCGDVPLLTEDTLQNLLDIHRKQKSSCTVLTVKLPDPGSYGRIIRKADGSVQRIVEYKDATTDERLVNEINSGIYCFNSKDLFQALSFINADNRQGEYYLTDTLEILDKKDKIISAVTTEDIDEVSGVNSQYQLAHLETQFYRQIRNRWLNNGVTIENPETVIIGENVKIFPDVHICANTTLKGQCEVHSNSIIGPNSFLKNVRLGEGVVTDGFNVLINTFVKKDTRIPWGEKIVAGDTEFKSSKEESIDNSYQAVKK